MQLLFQTARLRVAIGLEGGGSSRKLTNVRVLGNVPTLTINEGLFVLLWCVCYFNPRESDIAYTSGEQSSCVLCHFCLYPLAPDTRTAKDKQETLTSGAGQLRYVVYSWNEFCIFLRI